MTVYAKLRVSGVVFDPKTAVSAVTGELFVELTSDQLSTKGLVDSTPVGAAADADSLLIKMMQNLSGVGIPIGAEVCKLVNGGIALAESDIPARARVIGVAREAILNNAQGKVGLIGPNQPGVLAGLGFTPGDKVYMAETAGAYTNSLASFTGGNDRIVCVGIADCAAGNASLTVTDLIMALTEEVASLV